MSWDAYALLLLAPEQPLGSGWLGGDKVVGRGALRQMVQRAGRYSEAEQGRMSLHLPHDDRTLALAELRSLAGAP